MSDAIAGDSRHFKPVCARKPIRELDGRGEELVRLMTFGLDNDEAAGHGIPAYTPLDLKTAAPIAGLKQKNARFVFASPPFLKAYAENLSAIRKGHTAKAVETLADIMTDPGDNSAATKAVRIKAANSLLDTGESKSGGVSVNFAVNAAIQMQPGIVVRLPASAAVTPLELQTASEDGDAEPILSIGAKSDHSVTRKISQSRCKDQRSQE